MPDWDPEIEDSTRVLLKYIRARDYMKARLMAADILDRIHGGCRGPAEEMRAMYHALAAYDEPNWPAARRAWMGMYRPGDAAFAAAVIRNAPDRLPKMEV